MYKYVVKEEKKEYKLNEFIQIGQTNDEITFIDEDFINEEDKNISITFDFSASKITENDNFIVLLALINDDKVNLIYASSKNLNININNLLKDSIKLIDGNGGGTSFMAQGGGKNNGNVENTLNYSLNKLEKEML